MFIIVIYLNYCIFKINQQNKLMIYQMNHCLYINIHLIINRKLLYYIECHTKTIISSRQNYGNSLSHLIFTANTILFFLSFLYFSFFSFFLFLKCVFIFFFCLISNQKEFITGTLCIIYFLNIFFFKKYLCVSSPIF